jgi:hypothetical protein
MTATAQPQCGVESFTVTTTASLRIPTIRLIRGVRSSVVDVRQSAFYNAVFSHKNSNRCSCCEFRQYVRGSFSIWGIRIPHPLGGGRTLHPTSWQEDGASGGIRYGHRTDPNRLPFDVYANPDRPTGCVYTGIDFPGLAGLIPGTPYNIDLHFVSYITDTCRQGTELANLRFWRMVCAGTS